MNVAITQVKRKIGWWGVCCRSLGGKKVIGKGYATQSTKEKRERLRIRFHMTGILSGSQHSLGALGVKHLQGAPIHSQGAKYANRKKKRRGVVGEKTVTFQNEETFENIHPCRHPAFHRGERGPSASKQSVAVLKT